MDRATIGMLLAVVACLAACSGERATDATPTADATVARLLATPPTRAADDPEAWAAVRDAYARNGGQLLWKTDGRATAGAQGLRFAIRNVVADGLDPERYGLSTLAVQADASDEAAAAADVRLTLAAAQLARDLERGVTPSRALGKHWVRDAQREPLGALVHDAARSDEVERVLRRVLPQHPQYPRLRALLVDYRGIAARGGFPPVPASIPVKKGGSDPGVVALRARLAAGGWLRGAAEDPTFDSVLEETLKRYQDAHGLPVTGLPDKATLASLAMPVEERIERIALNLERWRWLPASLGDPHVSVNVPTYHLTVVERGRPALGMRIVAGKPESPTPIFSGLMQTVVLSPYWNVPSSILKDEVMPKLRQDPSYLDSQNMEVVVDGNPVDPFAVDLGDPGVRVRQRPGASNALGHVKFLFPNEFDVYLHDTPSDSLFARSERSFSHGCMRVEQPLELARWVLGPQPEWTPEKIEAGMYSGVEKHIALERDVPVHVLYSTVWVDDDGTVRFADDVYGHDRKQEPEFLAAIGAAPRSDVAVAARGGSDTAD